MHERRSRVNNVFGKMFCLFVGLDTLMRACLRTLSNRDQSLRSSPPLWWFKNEGLIVPFDLEKGLIVRF